MKEPDLLKVTAIFAGIISLVSVEFLFFNAVPNSFWGCGLRVYLLYTFIRKKIFHTVSQLGRCGAYDIT